MTSLDYSGRLVTQSISANNVLTLKIKHEERCFDISPENLLLNFDPEGLPKILAQTSFVLGRWENNQDFSLAFFQDRKGLWASLLRTIQDKDYDPVTSQRKLPEVRPFGYISLGAIGKGHIGRNDFEGTSSYVIYA